MKRIAIVLIALLLMPMALQARSWDDPLTTKEFIFGEIVKAAIRNNTKKEPQMVVVRQPQQPQARFSPQPGAPIYDAFGDQAYPTATVMNWLQRGKRFGNTGNWQEALKCFQQAISIDSNSVEAHLLCGGCTSQYRRLCIGKI